MIDLYLQASDEAAMIAALPLLRGPDPEGEPHWIISGPFHALDVGVAIVVTPPVIDGDGRVTRDAVLDPAFHMNLRLDERHPGLAEVLAAAEAVRTHPHTPHRIFA